MTYTFTLSPDLSPERLSGWFIFNTWLQRTLGESIHLELCHGFTELRDAIQAGRIDLIYANPYDAAMLVREQGFTAVGKPSGKSDEAIVAVNAEHAARSVDDLRAGVTVASTDDPDVNMMGMIMLEPADLNAANVNVVTLDSYVLVAKSLLRGDAEAGFFLAEAYHAFSDLIRHQLRPLVTSQIHVINHALMVGPRLANRSDAIQRALTDMSTDTKGQSVLQSLDFSGWDPVDGEEMEFMIDLMDTLMTSPHGNQTGSGARTDSIIGQSTA